MKRILTTLYVLCALLASQTAASAGALFNVLATGTPANLSITLCLNEKAPFTCRNYNVAALNLSLTTTTPNHFYPAAGIKINTPGYSITNAGLTCTPSTSGYCVFSVSNTQAKALTIVSNFNNPLVLSPSWLPSAELNNPYQQTLRTNGGIPPYVYTVTSGALPQGLSLSATGLISGTPTVADTSSFTVTVTDSNARSVSQAYSITTYSPSPGITSLGITVTSASGLMTYSPNNGATWGYMLSPQAHWGSTFNQITYPFAVTSDGLLYQSTGAVDTASTLIYTSNGIIWSPINNPVPLSNNYSVSVFAKGNILYTGTGQGYVYYTTDQGTTWLPNTPSRIPSNAVVNTLVVDQNGILYASGSTAMIYYSTNSGQSWSELPNQPAGGGTILNLAIDNNGTLYTTTRTSTTQPQYNYSPTTNGTWQPLSPLPGGSGNAISISVSGSTVYVGTSNGQLFSTSNLGTTWSGNLLPSNDGNGISNMFANQTTTLSSMFVESYGVIPLTNGAGSGSITVNNLTTTTASNVQVNSNQLPANVMQTSEPCASVAPGGSCTITLSANGTNAFSPTAFDIISGSGTSISRSALVSAITPDGGSNYYYVYNIDNGTAYVLDNNDASGGIVWSSNNSGSYDGGVAIYGISEISTTSSPNPSTGQISGQTACNGPINGSCDANNIQTYYSAIPTNYYAEGLCYQSSNGGATAGSWYLPAACELNGSIYASRTTNNITSCSTVSTGVASLNSLAALGGPLTSLLTYGYYWSSTEASTNSQTEVWFQYFIPTGGGSFQDFHDVKSNSKAVRCVRKLSI